MSRSPRQLIEEHSPVEPSPANGSMRAKQCAKTTQIADRNELRFERIEIDGKSGFRFWRIE